MASHSMGAVRPKTSPSLGRQWKIITDDNGFIVGSHTEEVCYADARSVGIELSMQGWPQAIKSPIKASETSVSPKRSKQMGNTAAMKLLSRVRAPSRNAAIFTD